MVPFFIYILLKGYGKKRGVRPGLLISKFLSSHSLIIFTFFLVLPAILFPVLSRSQNLQLNYKIIQGGDNVGWMHLEKNIEGNSSTFLMVSEIETRMIFRINVSAKESAFFESGKLIYSSQFRKTNGDIKLDKQTKLVADKYQVFENGKKDDLDFHFIGTNLLSLYFVEPVDINFVYCDNQACFIQITRTDDGGYKVKFPDGNSNCYYYSGGACTKIRITHTFYSAEIILNP